MKRASVSYVIMLVLFVIGQWAIVEFGTRLRAAPNIAGDWEINPHPDYPSLVPPYKKVTIDQSGKYVDVSFQQGPHLSAKMERLWHDIDGAPRFELKSRDLKLVFWLQVPSPNTMLCEIETAQKYVCLAHRLTEKP